MSVQVQFMMTPILHQAGRDINTDTEIQLFLVECSVDWCFYYIAASRIVCSPPSSSSSEGRTEKSSQKKSSIWFNNDCAKCHQESPESSSKFHMMWVLLLSPLISYIQVHLQFNSSWVEISHRYYKKEIHLVERKRASSVSYSENEKRENRYNSLPLSFGLSLSQLSIPISFSFLYDDKKEENKRDHHDSFDVDKKTK